MGKKQVEENGVLVVRPSDEYKKSNNLISAKYKSTLVENKLLNISLSKVNELRAEDVEIEGETVHVFTSVMHSSELVNTLGVTRKNLSTHLKSAYKKMAARQIGIEDDRGNFAYRNLFIGSDYNNGVFKLYYNPLLGKYYKQVEKSYTKLSLEAMMSFKSIHSLRLYELIKKECYIKGKESYDGPYIVYEVPYSVAELKLSLGIINADAPEVRSVLDSSNPPDYERAVDVAKEQKFSKFNDFKSKCIEPAIEEINETIPDMNIEYKLEKSGRGGKVQTITFIVKETNAKAKQEKEDVEVTLSELDEDDFIDEIRDMISGIKTREARSIAEAAKWDMALISRKYEMSKSQNIENIVGWLISAIKNDYTEPVAKMKSNQRSTGFNNFSERTYDYEELMKDMIK